MTDQHIDDVLAAAALGQGWALRALYDQLAPQVYGYLRGRGATEPEDLTSEVFLTVFTRLDTVTGGAAGLRTLVFSVAHARLVDDLRRRTRHPDSREYDVATDTRRSPSAEDDALGAMEEQAARSLIQQLPADQRDVLLLRLVADLTVEQTAAALGKSPGAVKQLQRRGLLTLRERAAGGRVPISGPYAITQKP